MRTRGRERGSGAAAGAHSAGLNRPAGWGQLAGAAGVLPARGASGPPGDLGCRRAHALGPAEETGETASPGESRPRARRILRRRQRGYGDGASRPEGDKKPPRPEAHVLRLWDRVGLRLPKVSRERRKFSPHVKEAPGLAFHRAAARPTIAGAQDPSLPFSSTTPASWCKMAA